MCKIILISKPDEINFDEILKTLGKEPIILAVNTDDENIDEFKNFLNSENLAALKKYRSNLKRTRFIKTRALVNMLVSKLNKTEISKLHWKDICGKAYIDNPLGIKFMISHSEDLSVLAFFRQNVALDIEDTRRNVELEKFKDAGIFNFDEDAYSSKEIFFKSFTTLEAYLKYIGKGFYEDVKNIYIRKYSAAKFFIADEKNSLKKEATLINFASYIIAIIY